LTHKIMKVDQFGKLVGATDHMEPERPMLMSGPVPPTSPPQDGVVVTDSGKRRDLPTGSRRDVRDGKGRYDLLQFRAMFLVARQLEEGAKKYGDRNWEKGQPLSWYVDSAIRHMGNFMTGKRDERHEVGAAWNIMCLLETIELIKEGKLPRELDDIGALDQSDASA
jgi:hypothetical protein